MSTLTRWEPRRDLSLFGEEMDTLVRNFFGPGNGERQLAAMPRFAPAVDIAETKDEYVVKAELPGLEAKDVEVKVENDVLTIQGDKRTEKEVKGKDFHRVECSYGAFHRAFTLPSTVKAEAVKAVCKNGVLEVTLPKTEQAKARSVKVEVKA